MAKVCALGGGFPLLINYAAKLYYVNVNVNEYMQAGKKRDTQY
jgi:hypothetical protein